MLAAAARIRLRSARITTWVTAWITWFADVVRICIAGYCAAVLQCVRRLDLFREQTRERRADRVLLGFQRDKAGRKDAELDRDDDLFFAADAERDDQVAAYPTVRVDGQISSAVVGRKSGFACGIAELREPRQERGVRDGRHTDLEKVCKYQRLTGIRDIDGRGDGEYRFAPAAVGKQQIQFNDHIAGDGDILCTEDRRTHALVIAFAGFRVQQFF